MFVLGSVPLTVLAIILNSCAIVLSHDHNKNQQYPYDRNLSNSQNWKAVPPNSHYSKPNRQSDNHYSPNNTSTSIETRHSHLGQLFGWGSSADYGQQHHYYHNHPQPAQGWGWPNQHNDHGHKHDFRSYFDIALTALAFLSFGTFLLNLLLNALLYAGLVTATGTGTGGITTTTGTTTGTQTGTQTGTSTQTATQTGTQTGITVTGRETGRISNVTRDDDDSRRSRPKRAPLELCLDPATAMDSLAHSVLKSIDAMIYKHECLGKVLCEGNRHAKVVGSGFQYLMPLYSVSASYMGKKFGWHDHLLDHLNAVMLGAGESNCQDYFPQC